ncbi:MAG: C1 family peptidase, partial [Pseudomonadota bacterium]
MPGSPAKVNYKHLVLDARPDRLDLRDREYRPHLRSLPDQYPSKETIDAFLPCYRDNGLVLNQGQQGACTGFGLAATINYLIWRDHLIIDKHKQAQCQLNMQKFQVSERMLYHMARVYDEWEGEDYAGSSCRGAVKGWHRHGVCSRELWPYDTSGQFIKPKQGWAENACKNTLGAYYRINHKSVVDMQAAIVEVGAIYCSASVHRGWQLNKVASLPTLKHSDNMIGGHAFCVIGYTQEGFIVQNSWGEDWGWHGFAVVSYGDWVDNANDAWVLARGVPAVQSTSRMFANHALQHTQSNMSLSGVGFADVSSKRKITWGGYRYKASAPTMPWSEERAYQHALVISNNGRPKHTVIEAEDCDASANILCYQHLKRWMAADNNNRKLVIYAHGGLTSEQAAIKKIQVMGPCFYENGIYPIYVVWKTGALETLNNMITEVWDLIVDRSSTAQKSQGLGEWISDRTDASIETLARSLRAKGFWSEMKENAIMANDRAVPGYAQHKGGKKGAMVLLAQALQALSKEFSDLQINAAAHSAGSIILGPWLNELKQRKLTVNTISLYAPACTLAFANDHYAKNEQAGVFSAKDLYIHNMDDEREKADTTSPLYRKSLLYLVSRALEDLHKMPLLGTQAAWWADNKGGWPDNYDEKTSGGFNATQKREADQWHAFIQTANPPIIYTKKKSQVKTNITPDYIRLSHGSFDNDIEVIEHTIKKILNTTKLKC